MMDRTDSAFDETFHPKPSHSAKHHTRRNHTTPKKERRSKDPSLQSSPDSPTTMKNSTTNPPVTSTRPSLQTKPPTPRRESVTSTTSSSSTNKSRKRNPGSLPSSRRTSCTIVDPSRPARHYRIRSTQTCPTVNGDIDDVLALHFRSCSLFQNPSYQQSSSLPNSPPPSSSGPGGSYGLGVASAQAPPPPPPPKRAATTDFVPRSAVAPDARPATSISPSSIPQHATPHLALSSPAIPTITTTITTTTTVDDLTTPSPIQNDDPSSPHLQPLLPSATTTHWLSPTTRRTQYAQIDRETTGVRGLVRRILPRCVSGPAAQGFYEKDGGGGDAGSVRRYRMDVDDESEVDDDEEKDEGLKIPKRKRGLEQRDERVARRWGCF
ncbi:hypothetical protein DM02DRAFT_674280 [Periconia macrospinosa]|uniref:Uncharacterized protein n=1 Tax=Periconia macrospinosa TaxID=97972 RepID=A0A2V1DGQ4_9PLEO|nr:hypothetical protein DM02DRAFT_674280 [Periconia macrospinosa]